MEIIVDSQGPAGCPTKAGGLPVDDLGFDIQLAIPWFPHEQDAPYVLVRVSDDDAKSWADALGVAVRRCYVSDSVVEEH